MINRMNKFESMKKHFSKGEDEKLKYLVSVFGDNNWSLVSQYMPGRQPRQCRERYIGYLMPSLVAHPWTEMEDELLIKKYEELGPKWVKFVPFFPGRSDSNIKNRWHKKLKNIYHSRKNSSDPSTESSPSEIMQMNVIKTSVTAESIIYDDIVNADEALLNCFEDFEFSF